MCRLTNCVEDEYLSKCKWGKEGDLEMTVAVGKFLIAITYFWMLTCGEVRILLNVGSDWSRGRPRTAGSSRTQRTTNVNVSASWGHKHEV